MISEELVAPCGMNCGLCVSYFGYTVKGKKSKNPCSGCRSRDKQCAFLKTGCEKLAKKKVEYCFECDNFPCKDLQDIDAKYRKKYEMSIIENLKNIEARGIENFLEMQEKKYKCPECDGTICVHTGKCYNCQSP